MAQGPDGKTIIIVKKVVGHGGGHGGSWKVAYADFVTSMMAFFMVLWLVNSASVQLRERIASYFRAPGVFEKGSGTPIESGGAGILPDAFAPPAEQNSQVQPGKQIYTLGTNEGEQREAFGEGGGEGQAQRGDVKAQGGAQGATQGAAQGAAAAAAEQAHHEAEKDKFEQIAKKIKGMIDQDKQKIEGLIGSIEVRVDQRGLHLDIMDNLKVSMFARGSSAIHDEAELELLKIAEYIRILPNPVDIEGHTDATPYRGKIADTYDNWNLSSDRANAARKILQKAGMREEQVARVVGYAASRPKITADPLAASNRRISISMRFTEQAAQSLRVLNAKETVSVPLRRPGEANAAKSSGPGKVANGDAKSGAPGQENKLDIEVSTSIPEGAVVEEVPSEVPTRPTWLEKDKIFGDKNPFTDN